MNCGNFKSVLTYAPSKEKVNPLTVRDDYSKYILSIKALDKGDGISVYEEFDLLFKLFGVPEIIRSDNGPPFAKSGVNQTLCMVALFGD